MNVASDDGMFQFEQTKKKVRHKDFWKHNSGDCEESKADTLESLDTGEIVSMDTEKPLLLSYNFDGFQALYNQNDDQKGDFRSILLA